MFMEQQFTCCLPINADPAFLDVSSVVRAAGALITPALFSRPPPVRREKRENNKGIHLF
jgi:hypothetical protein